jgi:hypothetical protein
MVWATFWANFLPTHLVTLQRGLGKVQDHKKGNTYLCKIFRFLVSNLQQTEQPRVE